MIPNSPLPQRFAPFKPWRAVAIGLAIGVVTPAFADNLPEVQRLIKKGQYPQALEKVDAYLTSKPKDAQGRFLKGLIYTEMNKPTEAIATFTQLTEDYPELPEPYNNLAVLYAQQKQYDKARTSLEMAIRTHPSYAIAYENLGDIYAKLASQAYDKALQLDSANATTQNKMALIRDLISTSGKGNVKPAAPATPDVVATPNASKPVSTPTAASATVVASTPGAAAATSNASETQVAPPKSSPAPVAATADEVAKTIANWAGAWSRKDIKTYLAQYAADFRAPKGQSRKAWEKERADRITGKRGTISVTYDEPKISVDGDHATAKFRQHYQAPGLSTSTNKTLILVRTGNRWLIQEENTR